MAARTPSTDAVTYASVGDTLVAGSSTPAGFRPTARDTVLGVGRELFERAATATLTWQIQRRAGIRVRVLGDAADARPLRVDDVVIMRVPLWPVDVPCRVVAVVDEPRRVGFAYGTLPGHPESGEEAFLVEHLADDSVVLRIRAFSQPSSWLFRIAYPAVLLIQATYTRRYARALRGI
jgi:uncharacterized protein (UPF0548 family)